MHQNERPLAYRFLILTINSNMVGYIKKESVELISFIC